MFPLANFSVNIAGWTIPVNRKSTTGRNCRIMSIFIFLHVKHWNPPTSIPLKIVNIWKSFLYGTSPPGLTPNEKRAVKKKNSETPVVVETDPPPVVQSVVDVVRHEDTRSSILSTSELQGWKLASKNNLEDDRMMDDRAPRRLVHGYIRGDHFHMVGYLLVATVRPLKDP